MKTGNLLSSRRTTDYPSDQYGRVVVTADDLYDMLINGIDTTHITEVEWNSDFSKYNDAIKANFIDDPEMKPLEKLSIDIEEFDESYQQDWFLPTKYMKLDVYKHILSLAPPEHLDRVAQELEMYDKYGLENVLRMCVYIVDIFRENNIVWGVGRGSSVASYVLYLIGIHKIDSIKYELDINEFLK